MDNNLDYQHKIWSVLMFQLWINENNCEYLYCNLLNYLFLIFTNIKFNYFTNKLLIILISLLYIF